jgi:hypothetical protein
MFQTFECKSCHSKAEVEELTKGISVLSCSPCEVNELWIEEEPEGLEYFLPVVFVGAA